MSVRDVINIYRDCAWSWGLGKNSCVSVRDYQLTVRDRAWSWATFSHAHISSVDVVGLDVEILRLFSKGVMVQMLFLGEIVGVARSLLKLFEKL